MDEKLQKIMKKTKNTMKIAGIMEVESVDSTTEDISASEDEGHQEKHEKLLDAIAELDGKKRKRKDLRIEPSSQVSEFNLATAASQNQVVLHELVGILKDTSSQKDIRKKLKSAKTKKVLPTPLNKFEQERVERSLAYEKNQKEVSKWLPIVQKNRQAKQLHFPLQKSSVKLETTDNLVQKFQPRTPLELEVAKMLHGSDHVLSKERMLTRAEERALKAMNLEEAKARRAELQKYRALLSYKEAKARRQNKIKSKKYHRILRKETLKKGQRALEDLKTSDPKAYGEKLALLEKERMQERMSLKHKGGSKFMAKQMIYGKYNKEARDNVQEMVKKNKELTTKIAIESDSESESELVKAAPAENKDKKTMFSPWTGSSLSGANPWMEPVKAKLPINYTRPEAMVNTEVVIVSDGEIGDVVSDMDTSEPQRRPVEEVIFDSEEESDSDSVVVISNSENKPVVIAQGTSSVVEEVTLSSSDSEEEQSPSVMEEVVLSSSDSDEVQVINEKDIDELFDELERRKNKRNQESKQEKVHKKVPLKKQKNNKKRKQKVEKIDSDDDDQQKLEALEVQDGGEELTTGSLLRKQTLEELGEWSDSEAGSAKQPRLEADCENISNNKSKSMNSAEKDISIDPKLVLTVETKIKNSLASNVVSDEEEGEDEDAQRMTISEAFVDDDVMEEFSKEKKAAIDRDKPKDLDLTLPGWGDWGGTGLVVSKRKRKRFRIKAAPAPPRKDSNLDNVILSETKDNSVAKHQVSNLPYTYNNVKQFESSVRAPIGKTWNPETSFRDLTKPKVLTRAGTIIEPMDDSVKYKKQKEMKKPMENKKVIKKYNNKSKKGKHKK
ncbi:U3 small nucleolar RNA-associated protein 14 homolog A-like [Lineus longissimus]|uniref:U3 small nucleolar RNA-associated protein 14 homolog A-like n=1 Tax=Lineus longissimus TaxID=88925 RepID=UPI002B4E32FB